SSPDHRGGTNRRGKLPLRRGRHRIFLGRRDAGHPETAASTMNRMTSDSAVYSVLSNYTAFRLGVQANRLGSGGGFSGSTLWRIRTADERDFCLRRWPAEHPSPERLTFIHSVLRAAAAG